MTIASSAMLVELNISVWTANKVDRTVTRQVTDDNHATTDAGQFKKNLTAGTTLRKQLADYAASCRLWHNTRTLPWSDRGPRLLATSLFFDYKKEANAREVLFNEMKDKFVSEYPTLLAEAPRHLGSMFDPSDYPSVDEVRSKFGFRLVFSPVPESGDFRLDLPAQELAEMRRQYDSAFEARLADAMREPWDRLHKMLTSMTDKLAGSLADTETKQRWHDTFVTNAQDLCELLTHLNVTNDPALEQARRDLMRAMDGVDIEDIKENAGTRSEVKDKLDALLKQYSW